MSKFTRVEPDDPNRCQAIGGNGQCPFRAVGSRANGAAEWDGPKYCPRHGSGGAKAEAKQESVRLYMSALWQEKIGRQADHPKIKSLREEVGIMRMMVEAKLNSFHDESSMLLHTGQMTEMLREIGKLQGAAHKIEKDMGQLLDRAQAEAWVQELLQIIGKYIDDPDILMALSEDMLESLERRCNAKSSSPL